MTDYPTPDRRPGRIAAALGTSRALARGLLAIPKPIRDEVLAEVVRVGPGVTLAYLRTQPSRVPH